MIKPYYQNDRMTIYCGDSMEIMPVLPQTDVVTTDPPFFLPPKQHGAEGREWAGNIGDFWILGEAFRRFIGLLKATVKDTGQIYIHCHERSYPVFYQLAYSVWPRLHLIVWYKPTGRIGHGWRHSHELILHLATEKTKYSDGFRQDVVGVMPVRTMKRGHPAEKPGELTDFLLEAVPSDAHTFLDPFMGSGNSLVVALKRGLHVTGIDIEEKYCALAVEKCRQQIMDLGI